MRALGGRVLARARGLGALGCLQRGRVIQRAESGGQAAQQPAGQLLLIARDEGGTQHVAQALAADRQAGDVYLLHGDVGAGKSAFSRAFIRAAAEDPDLTVPSPTFLLQLVYEEQEGPPIHHLDLYRLTEAAGMARLELGAAFANAVVLLEWPERLPRDQLPDSRLEVHIRALQPDDPAVVQQQGEGGAPGSCGEAAPAAAAGDAAAGAAAASGDAEDAGDDDDDDPYTDRRWRMLRLVPRGERWARRLQALQAQLQAHPAAGVRVLHQAPVNSQSSGPGLL